MKVFVSGSRDLIDVYTARDQIPVLLGQMIEDKDIILVGDEPGFDLLVQEFCAKVGYRKVLVYHNDESAQNNVGDFMTHQVKGPRHAVDQLMAKHCDVGLCYWNGTSRGTKEVIERFTRMEKPCKVIIEEPEETVREEAESVVEIKTSAKMKKGIKLIEDVLGIKYTGKTFDDAKKFLDENLSKLDGKDFRESKKPSEKQLKGIHFIESMLDVEFKGASMKDASDFLDAHFEEAKKKSDYLKERKKK